MEPRILCVRIWLLVACFCPRLALAAFDRDNRSVNGTGELLHEGSYELGLMKTQYGLNDDWMLTLPSTALLLGYGRLEAKRRIRLEGKDRLSPYVFAETPRRLGFGMDWGRDFGDDSLHALTVGARVQFTPRAYKVKRGPQSRTHAQILPNIEYDFYGRGNDAYVGIADYLPYAGYTWAFAIWHFGLIVGPYTSFIPLPYAYLRF